MPAPLSTCRAGSQQGPLPCSRGDRTGGAGAGSVPWVLAVSPGCTSDASVVPGWRDRHQEGGGKGRTLRGCLCCSHSCTPLISPCGAGKGCVKRIFSLPWGIRGGKWVFFIHITPEYSLNYPALPPGQGWDTAWSPTPLLQQPCCSEGEN